MLEKVLSESFWDVLIDILLIYNTWDIITAL